MRVGLVGASAAGRGWGAMAHVPAIRSVDGVELAAVCTSRPESAAAAADAYGVRAFHDVHELTSQPDIDLVAVVVRVPRHHDAVMPALAAGKHVFCEWPLGADLREAQAMSTLARSSQVLTAIGLQGRQDPSLTYVRQLREEGWLGDLVSVTMTMFGGGAGRSVSGDAWTGKARSGANLLTIVAGHSLDHLSYALAPLAEVSAKVTTQVPRWHLADTDETIEVDAPDNVALVGTLVGGARLSFHMASVPGAGSGWRMAVYGTRGTLVATTQGLPQIAPLALEGARGDEPLAPLPLPEHLRRSPDSLPAGPAANLARAYDGIARALREGRGFEPDFDHATRLHEVLEAVRRSSEEGRAVRLH